SYRCKSSRSAKIAMPQFWQVAKERRSPVRRVCAIRRTTDCTDKMDFLSPSMSSVVVCVYSWFKARRSRSPKGDFYAHSHAGLGLRNSAPLIEDAAVPTLESIP